MKIRSGCLAGLAAALCRPRRAAGNLALRKTERGSIRMKEVGTARLGVGGGRGRLNGRGANMATLAPVLSGIPGRVVSDRSGLSGYYDFTLEWAPDDAPDAAWASLFTAIQEQLGLRLEWAKGPVEVLVIDRVEKPSEN